MRAPLPSPGVRVQRPEGFECLATGGRTWCITPLLAPYFVDFARISASPRWAVRVEVEATVRSAERKTDAVLCLSLRTPHTSLVVFPLQQLRQPVAEADRGEHAKRPGREHDPVAPVRRPQWPVRQRNGYEFWLQRATTGSITSSTFTSSTTGAGSGIGMGRGAGAGLTGCGMGAAPTLHRRGGGHARLRRCGPHGGAWPLSRFRPQPVIASSSPAPTRSPTSPDRPAPSSRQPPARHP